MVSKKLSEKIKKLPKTAGVYIFKDKSGILLYVGKAASLKSRVSSYFAKNLNYERPIEFVIDKIFDIEIKKTDTVIEAYFLEQEIIKKHQPKYNTLGKDDKSFVYVCLTRDDFPRFVVRRKTDLEDEGEKKYKKVYGPYAARHLVENALRILRKIFPYHNSAKKTEVGCLDYQIGLCPGPHDGAISKRDYAKNIKGIEMMMKGKKKSLIKTLEKEMREHSKLHEFEKAAEKRNQIFSLKHIQDIAMISKRSADNFSSDETFRIEGYDISNISGNFCVGSMVVFDNENGELEANKKRYRKFKIKTVDGVDDVAALKEVLFRRFRNDWPLPTFILLDGGVGHLNMAKELLQEMRVVVPILAVSKGPKRNKLDLNYLKEEFKDKTMKKVIADEIIIASIRDEAHRFAISYHRKLREKTLR